MTTLLLKKTTSHFSRAPHLPSCPDLAYQAEVGSAGVAVSSPPVDPLQADPDPGPGSELAAVAAADSPVPSPC